MDMTQLSGLINIHSEEVNTICMRLAVKQLRATLRRLSLALGSGYCDTGAEPLAMVLKGNTSWISRLQSLNRPGLGELRDGQEGRVLLQELAAEEGFKLVEQKKSCRPAWITMPSL